MRSIILSTALVATAFAGTASAQGFDALNTDIGALSANVQSEAMWSGNFSAGFLTPLEDGDALWGFEGEIQHRNFVGGTEVLPSLEVTYVPSQYGLPDIWEVDANVAAKVAPYLHLDGGINHLTADSVEATTPYFGIRTPFQYGEGFTVVPEGRIACNADACEDAWLGEFGGGLSYTPAGTPLTFAVEGFALTGKPETPDWRLGAGISLELGSLNLGAKEVRSSAQITASKAEGQDALAGARFKLQF